MKNTVKMKSISDKRDSGNQDLINEANTELVNMYDKFIYGIIHEQYKTYEGEIEHFKDLYQSGMEGLLKAIRSYNPDLGKFSTYSIRYIKHEMTGQIDFWNNDTQHFGRQRKIIGNASRRLEMEGKESSDAAIAEITGLSKKAVKREREREKRTNMVYLDKTENGCEDRLPMVPSAEQCALQEEEWKKICEVKEGLPEELRAVWDMRYVMGMPRSKTAEALNISKYRVRKYENSIRKRMESFRKKWNS